MDTQPQTSADQMPTPPTPAPVMTGTGESKLRVWLPKIGIVVALVFLLAAAAYGGYYWEHMRAAADEATLQQRIDDLKAQQSSKSPSGQTAINSNNPACTDVDLALAKVASQSAAGTLGITYSFTNKSASACTLTAAPTVTLLDTAGKQLGEMAQASAVSDVTITLQANEKAYATVLFPNAANFAAGKCSASEADGLSLVPSKNSNALEIGIAGQHYCPGFAVQPFTATAP